MAISYSIPHSKSLMLSPIEGTDGCPAPLVLHGKELHVFPKWENVYSYYTAKDTDRWGGLDKSQSYENNVFAWRSPWQTKPPLPSESISDPRIDAGVFWHITKGNLSGEEFIGLINFCSTKYNTDFVVGNTEAWAWVSGVQQSEEVTGSGFSFSLPFSDTDSDQLVRDIANTINRIYGINEGCVAGHIEGNREDVLYIKDGEAYNSFVTGIGIGGIGSGEKLICDGAMVYRKGEEYAPTSGVNTPIRIPIIWREISTFDASIYTTSTLNLAYVSADIRGPLPSAPIRTTSYAWGREERTEG